MLILPLHVTHNILTHAVTAFDVTNSRDAAGRPLASQGDDYTVHDANVQPASDDLVALLPEGAQTDGVLVMHTRVRLKIATNRNGSQVGEQSYIRMNDNVWKVWAIQDWRPHAVIQRYLLTRYIDIDGQIV